MSLTEDEEQEERPASLTFHYAVEMNCDFLTAGRAYGRSAFTFASEYAWWQRKKKNGVAMTPQMKDFVEALLGALARTEDISLLRPASTRRIYEACVGPVKGH